MSLSVGISPCPNDIYTYAGLLTKAIPNNYNFRIGQIGDLNQWASRSEVDVCKISVGSYPSVKDAFRMSTVGGSFATENGPKLVFHKNRTPKNLNAVKVATPGLTTTASLVLSMLFPGIKQVREDLKDIPRLVCDGSYDAAIILNESMGELAKYGLVVKYDLADYWHMMEKVPLPLGVVVVNRKLSLARQQQFEKEVQKSFQWAQNNHNKAIGSALEWAAEKDVRVIEKHVHAFTTFVEDSSSCKKAITTFLKSIKSSKVEPAVCF